MSTVALYEGECVVCEEKIHEGDVIVNVDGYWCHADCAEER